MPVTPLLQKVDAVAVPVPDLDAGLRFYRDRLGHELRWRNDQIGQAGLAMPGSGTEIVLTTGQKRTELAGHLGRRCSRGRAGGRRSVVTAPFDIPVGRAAVVADRSATSSSLSTCPRAAT